MKAGRGLVIGVHVRYVRLNGAVHMLQQLRKNDTMATYGFMSCLAKVGGIARAAGARMRHITICAACANSAIARADSRHFRMP